MRNEATKLIRKQLSERRAPTHEEYINKLKDAVEVSCSFPPVHNSRNFSRSPWYSSNRPIGEGENRKVWQNFASKY